MKTEWLKEIKLKDLPDPYPEIAEKFGIEVAVGLALHFAGMGLYFPKIDSALRKIRNEKIRKEFDGCNHRILARKYDLAERHVRRLVDANDDHQIGMF